MMTAKVKLPVDDHTDEETIEHRDDRRFRRREDPAVHTAQDDKGGDESPEGLLEGLPDFPRRSPALAPPAFFP
jgi:hypothetical protein